MRVRYSLSIIFFSCAAMCMVYFGVIVGYSGIDTSLCSVWIIFALLFAAMAYFLRTSKRYGDEMPRLLPTFIYTSFGMLLLSFVFIMNLVIGASREAEDQRVDYCVVMGARVYSNGISKTLMYRLDKAAELYHMYPETVFVLAGGQAQGDPIPEAFAMYNYLSLKGVPSGNMLMEARSVNTFGIVQNASKAIRADFERRRNPLGPGDRIYPPDYELRVGIITSDYHMFRSITLAEESDMGELVPIPAISDDVLYVHNCVRESVAIVKDFFMGNVTVDEEHMPELPFNRVERNP